MKKILLQATIASLVVFSANAQNVGIGIPLPTQKLHIDDGHIKIGNLVWTSSARDRFIKFGDDDFVFLGESGEDDRMEFFARHFIFKPTPGGSSTYTGNIGIGTISAPTAKLEVIGNIKITDGTQGVNKILTSDATGTASWQILPASNAGFKVTKSISQSVGSGATPFVTFDIETYDDGGNFSTVTSSYTAPADGLYHFDAMIYWALGSLGSFDAQLDLYVNLVKLHSDYQKNALNNSQSLSCDIRLTAGQTVALSVSHTGTGSQILQGDADKIFFSGHRVY